MATMLKFPDLNNHYTDDWQAIILVLLLDKSIIDDINSLIPWKDIEQKCKVAATKELPYQYDFIREQIAPDSIQQELSLESLYSQPTNENLFYQRMILFLESVGINGFSYPNFTEGGGLNSYIIFRQNNVVRLDKNVSPLPEKNNISQLRKIEKAFAARYKPRQLNASEIQVWAKKLHDFYDFKISEIALQKHKAEIIAQQK